MGLRSWEWCEGTCGCEGVGGSGIGASDDVAFAASSLGVVRLAADGIGDGFVSCGSASGGLDELGSGSVCRLDSSSFESLFSLLPGPSPVVIDRVAEEET